MSNIEAKVVIKNEVDSSIAKQIDNITISAGKASTSIKNLKRNLSKISVNVDGSKLRNLRSQINNAIGQREYRIKIKSDVDVKGISSIGERVQAQRKHISSFTDDLVKLRNVAAGLFFTGGAVTGSMKVADIYQSHINRLAIVTSNAKEAESYVLRLIESAKSSYTSVDANVKLFGRLRLAMETAGGSAREALSITENLSKAIALSGLTSGERASALLQISQAFNKGKLDGDEFRSVMENLPIFADSLAKSLGKTRGELFALSRNGELLFDVMKKAALDMGEAVDQKFGQITPTFEMAVQNLKTALETEIGQSLKNYKLPVLDLTIPEATVSSLKYLTENVGELTNSLKLLGYTLVGTLGLRTLSGTIVSISTLNKSILATIVAAKGAHTGMTALFAVLKGSPFTLVASGVGLLVGAIEYLSSQFGNAEQQYKKFELSLVGIKQYTKDVEILKGEIENASTRKLHIIDGDNTKQIENIKNSIVEIDNIIKQINSEYTESENRIERLNSALSKVREGSHAYHTVLKQIDKVKAEQEEKLHRISQLEEQRVDLQRSLRDVRAVESDLLTKIEAKLGQAKRKAEELKSEGRENTKEYRDQVAVIAEIEQKFANVTARISEARAEAGGLLRVAQGIAKQYENIGQIFERADMLNSVQNSFKAKADEELAYAKMDKRGRLTVDIESKMKRMDEKGYYELKSNPEKFKETLDYMVNMSIESEKIYENEKALAKLNNKKSKSSTRTSKRKSTKLSETEKGNRDFLNFEKNLRSEYELLRYGAEELDKYRGLYEEVNRAQTRGVKITQDKINSLKEQIDINRELKETQDAIYNLEKNSATENRKRIADQLRYIGMANMSNQDKIIARDEVMDKGGYTVNRDQGVEVIRAQYQARITMHEDYLSKIGAMEESYTIARVSNELAKEKEIFNKRVSNLKNMDGVYGVIGEGLETFASSASSVFTNLLDGTTKWRDGLLDIAKNTMGAIQSAIIEIGVKAALNHAMSMTMNQQATAQAVANNAAITASAAPAAVAQAGASWGASATTAVSALAALTSMIPVLGTRRHGGAVSEGQGVYRIGEGGPEIFKGFNGNQYFLPPERGRIYPMEKTSNVGGGNVNINVENYTSGEVSVEQNGDNIRIMISEAISEQTPALVRDFIKSREGQRLIK